jgi:hypothetical protein
MNSFISNIQCSSVRWNSTDVSEEHVASILLYLLPASRCFLACLIIRPWIWRRHIPPKRRLNFNRLHGVIQQKIDLFIITGVKASYPTQLLSPPEITSCCAIRMSITNITKSRLWIMRWTTSNAEYMYRTILVLFSYLSLISPSVPSAEVFCGLFYDSVLQVA